MVSRVLGKQLPNIQARRLLTSWNFEDSDVIQYLSSDPDLFIRTKVHNHVDKVIKGDLKGQFTSAFQRPVCLAPGRDTTLFNLIVCGSKESVHSQLDAFRDNEEAYTAKASQAADEQEKLLPGADRYAFARQLMQATILRTYPRSTALQRRWLIAFSYFSIIEHSNLPNPCAEECW